jgi:hypothetical protein
MVYGISVGNRFGKIAFHALLLLALPTFAKLPLELSASQKISFEAEAMQAKDGTPLDPEGIYAAKDKYHGELVWEGRSNLLLHTVQAHAEWFAEMGYSKDSSDLQKTLIPSSMELNWRPWQSCKTAIGIQKWNRGVAYAWNPSNPIGDRNGNNTDGSAYRRQGDPFLQFTLTGSQWNIEALAVKQGDDDQPLRLYGELYHALLSCHILFDKMDLTLSAGQVHGSKFSGMAISTTVSEGLELHGEAAWWDEYQQWQVHGVAAGNTPNAMIYYLKPDKYKNGLQSVLGGQFTFATQTNLLAEYLYQGTGMNQAQYTRWLNAAARVREGSSLATASANAGFLAQSNSLPGFIRQHYVFARIMQPIGQDGMEASMYFRSNLEEAGDLLVGGSMKAYLSDAILLKLYAAGYGDVGDTETQIIPIHFDIGTTLQFIF